MKTKNEVEEIDNNKGKIMMLSCDAKSKEERAECEKNWKNERTSIRWNIGIKFQNKAHENRISEVAKQKDSTNIEERMKNKYWENGHMLIWMLENFSQKSQQAWQNVQLV